MLQEEFCLCSQAPVSNRVARRLPVSYTHLDVYKRQPLSIDVVAIGVGGRLMILLIGGYIEPAENIVPLPSHRIASFEGISKKTYVGVLVPAAIWLLNMGHIK